MANRGRFYENPWFFLAALALLIAAALISSPSPAAGSAPLRPHSLDPELPTPTPMTPSPTPPPPTVGCPVTRGPLTYLNPIYAPCVETPHPAILPGTPSPTPRWLPRFVSSYDRSAGNWDWYPSPTTTPACYTPVTLTPTSTPAPTPTPPGFQPTVVWLEVPETVSGVISRIYMGQPMRALGGYRGAHIQIYSPPDAPAPVATIVLDDLLSAADYPLVAHSKYSSGGDVLYRPFGFKEGLRIVSVGAGQTFFQVHYYEVPEAEVTPGWNGVEALAERWRTPANMGKTVDQLSVPSAPTFGGVETEELVGVALPAHTLVAIFHDEAAGTVIKIAFPARTLPSPMPTAGRSPFSGISLTVRYSETEAASVTLPLDLLFLSRDKDYTPARPPVGNIDAMTFSPDGKFIMVQGDTAWVLEPVAYDMYYLDTAPVPENAGAVWYRLRLSRLLSNFQGGIEGAPPDADVDTYALHALRAVDGQVHSQGEAIIQGGTRWYRQFMAGARNQALLESVWGQDPTPPPLQGIDAHAYGYDRGTPAPSPIVGEWVLSCPASPTPIPGATPTPGGPTATPCQAYWESRVPREYQTSWESHELGRLWPFYTGQYLGRRVDAYVLSPLGEMAISEDGYWSCPLGNNCALPEGWLGPTSLAEAWWMDPGVYNGSLFFGYNDHGTTDPGDDEYYLTLPIPYRRGVTVSLLNERDEQVSLDVSVLHTSAGYGPESGYLDIHYVEGNSLDDGQSLAGWPNPVLATTLRRRGKLVGLVRLARGEIEHCWGRTFLEGDEIIVVDNEQATLCSQTEGRWTCDCEGQGTYVQCGTGMEELSNGGWYFLQGPFYLPMSGVPLSPPNRLPLPPLAPTAAPVVPTATPTPVPICGAPVPPTFTPSPTPVLCGAFPAYPYNYLGELNEFEGTPIPGGAAYPETETLMYRFFLNDAIVFNDSLQIGEEFLFCPVGQEGQGITRWGITGPCRDGMAATLGIMTIAYMAPVDQSPPASNVNALSPYQNGDFDVSWTGDPGGGTPITTYDIQVREGQGPWAYWLTRTSGESAVFTGGTDGHTFYFRGRARDADGNVEVWPDPPAGYDALTTVDLTPPSSSASTPLDSTNQSPIAVDWSAADGTSGVALTELWYRLDSGVWLASGLSQGGESGTFFFAPPGGTNGTYSFATRAGDNAGNWEWVGTPPSGDDQTLYDTFAPVSEVEALPACSGGSFAVSWIGSDPSPGSGIQSYDVQTCTVDCQLPEDAVWVDWLVGTTESSASFSGEHDHGYYFRSRARDHAGNEESYPDAADAHTIADTIAPETAVDHDPPPLDNPSPTFTVFWHGADAGCGLDHYDLFYRDESAASWTSWLLGLPPGQTAASFSGLAGHTYYFCSRGVDEAGNAETCPPLGPGMGEWPVQGDMETRVRPWSRVNPLPANTPYTPFIVSWQGSLGVSCYDVQKRDGQFGTWQSWLTNACYTQASFLGQPGHIYYFRSRARWGVSGESWPYDYDTYTKVGTGLAEGGLGGGGAALPGFLADEAPDLWEAVTRTEALGVPVVGYIAPAGDVDWYRFEFTETMRVGVRLDELPADYDLYLFDGGGQFLWASTWWWQLPEEVVVRVPAGVYYVRLDGYAGAGSVQAPYRLLVERAGP